MLPSMSPDREAGITSELHFLLEPEWTLTRQSAGFRVGPPARLASAPVDADALAQLASRVADFIGAGRPTEITREPDGSVRVVIWWQERDGTEIFFDPIAKGLPNHRPRPVPGDSD